MKILLDKRFVYPSLQNPSSCETGILIKSYQHVLLLLSSVGGANPNLRIKICLLQLQGTLVVVVVVKLWFFLSGSIDQSS